MALFVDNSIGPQKPSLNYSSSTTEDSKPKSVKRTLFTYDENVAPSTRSFVDIKVAVEQHASDRIVCLRMLLRAVHKLAVRSDETVTAVTVENKGATMQVGTSEYPWCDAAHYNPVAGLRDDLLKQMEKQIAAEQKITPKKKMLFQKGFGLTDSDIKKIEDSCGLTDFSLSKFISEDRMTGVLFGGLFMKYLNGTNCMPKDLNRVTDALMEKALRPLICDKIIECMQGRVNPDEAISTLASAIKGHFDESYEALDKKLKQLEELKVALEQKKPITADLVKQINKKEKGVPSLDLSAENITSQAVQKHITRLTKLRDYAAYQAEGTKVPKAILLEGKMEDGKRVRLSQQEEEDLGYSLLG